MKSHRLIGLVGTFLLGLSWAQAEDIDAASRAAAERVAIGTCATCHGPQGHSFSPKFPVLAGQQASYLASQLQGFKAQTRGDADALGYMWGMAAPLNDELIAGPGDYYSRQTPRAGDQGDPSLIARGKDIYQNGTVSKAYRLAAHVTDRGPQAHRGLRAQAAIPDSPASMCNAS
jgi:cytochrome c553